MNQQIAPLPREVSIAVIGAGTMGGGIALVAATAGHSVLLYDAAPGAAAAGCKRQRADLEKLVTRGRLTRRNARTGYPGCIRLKAARIGSAGLVIEAIVENLNIKVDVLRQVEEITGPQTILATNTSSLSVTALSSRMRRPSRVVGMHFFNPAPVMPLVEVISGRLTELPSRKRFSRRPRAGARLRSIAPLRRGLSSIAWPGHSMARHYAFFQSVRRLRQRSMQSSGRRADFGWGLSRSWI